MKRRAIVYCESQFGSMDGKTANGLIRESGVYEIVAVIDSTKAGQDSGQYLDGKENGIPLCTDLEYALSDFDSLKKPNYFILGIAPADAFLKENERDIVIQAMKAGLNIVNPLQEFLTEDQEMMQYAKQNSVNIHDIRKPKPKKDWNIFSGRIMQGASYGFAIDAFPLQFVIGELENEIVKANEVEQPDVIIVEGQGALSNPAYARSSAILRGARPKAVIVQHPPKRKVLGDFPYVKMPTLKSEIDLIEHYAETKVIAITLNHEDMTDPEIDKTIMEYEQKFNLPTTDVLKLGSDKVVDSIIEYFPGLKQKAKRVIAI